MRSKTINTELIDVLKTLVRVANKEDAAVWDAVADKLRKR
jgi:ribosomal protein L18E